MIKSVEGADMNNVCLTGQLVCRSDDQAAAVAELLPEHIKLTREESGCISFQVTPTDDPRTWNVSEVFSDASSFKLHQDRVKMSAWGHGTVGIARRYTVTGA